MADMRSYGMLQRTSKCIESDIQDILQSGNYYVTEEIARELSVIDNAIQHIALDDTFLATSKEWQAKPGNYTSCQTNQQLSNALSAINQTGARLREYKNRLSNQSIAGKQENQLREIHQWAISSLRENQKQLDGVTMNAADRIKQFGDTIGVTDRYTGYRQNLTRGTRDPFKMQTSWMEKSGQVGFMNDLTRSHTTIGSPCLTQKPLARSMTTLGETGFGPVPKTNIGILKNQIQFESGSQPMRVTRGYRTIDSLYPKGAGSATGGAPRTSGAMNEVKLLNNLNASDMYAKMENVAGSRQGSVKQPYEMMSVQEQAGINTTFPGRTEYMQRYKAPATDLPTCDFLINPSPNFAIYGRPMQRAVYVPSFTEYQTRYDWPDAEKIVKLPWLRN